MKNISQYLGASIPIPVTHGEFIFELYGKLDAVPAKGGSEALKEFMLEAAKLDAERNKIYTAFAEVTPCRVPGADDFVAFVDYVGTTFEAVPGLKTKEQRAAFLAEHSPAIAEFSARLRKSPEEWQSEEDERQKRLETIEADLQAVEDKRAVNFAKQLCFILKKIVAKTADGEIIETDDSPDPEQLAMFGHDTLSEWYEAVAGKVLGRSQRRNLTTP